MKTKVVFERGPAGDFLLDMFLKEMQRRDTITSYTQDSVATQVTVFDPLSSMEPHR